MRKHRPSSRQRGLTLIEFMVSIVLGMILVAALATLIADQSTNRAEVDRGGRMIENGRYAIRNLADELQMAGYWGELTNTLTAAAMPDPCSVVVLPNLKDAMALHVQGYSPPAASARPGYNSNANPWPPAETSLPSSCLPNRRPGTDVLVVRRVDPDSSDVTTAGVYDPAKVTSTQVYVQTGLNTASASAFTYVVDSGTNKANFILKKKDKVTVATPRKMVVRLYYVADCSVCSGGSADTIPTLKMVELEKSGVLSTTPLTIAEGVENLQVDYGVDSDNDGAPDGDYVEGTTLTAATWPNVMSVRLNLLVRSPEITPGYTDAKTYAMGSAGTVAAAGDGYKRHVFTQVVRLVNPSGRRMP